MHDDVTKSVIGSCYKIKEMSEKDISKLLSKTYAEICTVKMGAPKSIDELKRLGELEKVASTLESIVLNADIDDMLRRGCAFVAASSRLLVIKSATQLTNTHLTPTSISSEISATLLFLISGQISDAEEVVKNMHVELDRPYEGTLLANISRLVRGRLGEIGQDAPPKIDSNNLYSSAYLSLVATLNSSLADFSKIALSTSRMNIDMPIKKIARVKEMCIYENTIPVNSDMNTTVTYGIYGVYHIASLIELSLKCIRNHLLTRVDEPKNTNSEVWKRYVLSRCKRKPYLWPNHITAIKSGVLDLGTSAIVTFPTGSGKTTLIDLKIASTLTKKYLVFVFLPTLALVEQYYAHFCKEFSDYQVNRTVRFKTPIEPQIVVSTPEQYLSSTINFESTSDVGLVVFDEFHLVHPTSQGLRRNIDAMLALLDTLGRFNSDYLLTSAMVSNGEELARWLNKNGKKCLTLDGKWKPTRQIRGCVTYSKENIENLNRTISKRQQAAKKSRRFKTKSTDSKQLMATPYSVFCLTHTWESHDSSDYSILQLLPARVELKLNEKWKLTPNKNHVSAKIASTMAKSGFKVIVFVNDSIAANSISRSIALTLKSTVELNDSERLLYNSAIEDVGDDKNVFSPYNGISCQHHASMLKSERLLSESIFKREDGAHVLVATSTLAQGLNLPADCVILVGDKRFDVSAGQQIDIDVQHLLNAAGRAGRSGHSSHGLVLVVPSDIVVHSMEAGRTYLDKKWFELQQRVFSNPDQCLKIKDPIETVVDRLYESNSTPDRESMYFLQRLPHDNSKSIENTLNRTFFAYKARLKNNSNIDSKIKKVIQSRSLYASSKEPEWVKDIALQFGISIDLAKSIRAKLSNDQHQYSINQWLKWFFKFIEAEISHVSQEINVAILDRIWGTEIGKSGIDEDNNESKLLFLIPKISRVLTLWVDGAPLIEIQKTLPGRASFSTKARAVVSDLSYDFSYLIGVVSSLYSAMNRHGELEHPSPIHLQYAPKAIRQGLNRPDLLALKEIDQNARSRKQISLLADQYSEIIGKITHITKIEDLRNRIKSIGKI